MIDFASVSWVVNYEIFTLLFTTQINSTKVSVIVCNWVDIYLYDILIDLSETLKKFFFKLFFSFSSILEETLSNQWKIRIIFLIVEKEPNLVARFVQNAKSNLFIQLISFFRTLKFEKSTRKNFMSLVLLNLFLFD
jgi:hypothetical protein